MSSYWGAHSYYPRGLIIGYFADFAMETCPLLSSFVNVKIDIHATYALIISRSQTADSISEEEEGGAASAPKKDA